MHISKSVTETHSIAKIVLVGLAKKRSKTMATVVVCSGNLGSGKTAFVKGIAKVFGIKERVTSPTFVIEKIYKIPAATKKRFGFSHLIHIDAYRLENPGELSVLGFNELIKNKENLIIIEWGEKVKRILPKKYRHLHFEFVDKKTRYIKIEK